ncbi:MAG: hypothetical protein GF388_05330 [Candidatus Aegiribacteria sp.]|nr:hypothetical protein [Candidatus Aegiribacteria sp.]MBD3294632.1 hypothetical protein [Candidatus Fermentibacteria bacterium]
MKYSRTAVVLISAFAAVLLTMGSGCLPGPYEAGTPDSLFSEFVLIRDLMSSYYACFAARDSMDWSSVYLEYRSRAQNLDNRDEMIELSLDMLGELEDMSLIIFDSSGGLHESFDPDYFQNWDRQVFGSYLTSWGQKDSIGPYHSFPLPSPMDSIGYMYIQTLGDSFTIEGFFVSTAPVAQCSVLILDLRFCKRIGHEVNAYYSMGRFTGSSALGYYKQIRNGPDPLDMGEPVGVYALKNGSWQFTGPTLVLTGRGTHGAAELLALLLKTQDHVTVIGDTTAGFANPTDSYNLTESWTIEIPEMVTYDSDMNLMFDNPVIPDSTVHASESDFAAGVDPVLDAAVDILASGSIPR